jgi:hypothetical protein
VETTLARLPMPLDDVVEAVRVVGVAARAFAAIGVLDRVVGATIGTEFALALVGRGHGDLDFDAGEFGDIASLVEGVRRGGRVPSLVQVTATDDVVVEQWTDHARVINADGEYLVDGQVDTEGGGRPSRHVEARVGPVDTTAYLQSLPRDDREIASAAFTACSIAASTHSLSMSSPGLSPGNSSKATVVAVSAAAPGGALVVVTVIRGGRRVAVRTHGAGPVDVAWLRSDSGLRHARVDRGARHGPWMAYDVVATAALPTGGALALVLVADGHAIEVDLR